MSRWWMITVLMLAFSLAQQVEPKVPPPAQPREPITNQGKGLEVQVWFKGEAAEGVQVSLWELGPGGRLLPPKVRPFSIVTDAAGMARWTTGLGEAVWVVRLQARDGFSISLPASEGYLATPLQVGPYRVELRLSKP